MKKWVTFVCALLLAFSVPGAVFAVTDTTEVTGTIGESISLTTPTTIALGSLTVPGNTASGDSVLCVYANNSTKTVSLVVRDNKQVTNIGKMTQGANVLTDVLNVKGADQATYVGLPTAAATTITLENAGAVNGDTGEYTVTDFSVRQYVYWSDEQAEGYSITLYFEAAYTT